MSCSRCLLAALTASIVAACAAERPPEDWLPSIACHQISDDELRLHCYDTWAEAHGRLLPGYEPADGAAVAKERSRTTP